MISCRSGAYNNAQIKNKRPIIKAKIIGAIPKKYSIKYGIPALPVDISTGKRIILIVMALASYFILSGPLAGLRIILFPVEISTGNASFASAPNPQFPANPMPYPNSRPPIILPMGFQLIL